tara:strand:- start:1960 stop:2337 length:378 start_codon:yes stop_codon:yes gene_type:complete
MAFSYCPHCGFKNMYSLQAPKFCGGCGSELSLLSAAKQTSTNTAKIPKPTRMLSRDVEDSDDPDGTDVYSVPQIKGLAYSLEMDRNSFKLSDVLPEEIFDEKEAAEEKPKSKPKTKAKRGRPRRK